MISTFKHYFFIGSFFVIMLYSLYGIIWDGKIKLSGVIQNIEKPTVLWSDILSGKYQKQYEDYFNNNFYGRELLIKLRSQFMYSFFSESPNNNVVIGANGYLYEPGYIFSEFDIYNTNKNFNVEDMADKLSQVSKLLEKNGKKLYVFITPNKVFYTKDKVPLSYSLVRNSNTNILVDKFTTELRNKEINFINSRDIINEKLDDYQFPIFYSTGIHWSRAWGVICVNELWNLINKTNNDKYSLISINFEKNDKVEWPDADLFQTLNLFTKPRDNYHQGRISILEKRIQPNVFARGGSFLGQSWSELVRSGVFNRDIHYENNYFFTNNYSTQEVLSSFESYNENDIWKSYFVDSDIVVLEINEAAITRATFGFVDYILTNKNSLGLESNDLIKTENNE